jgi:dephospho-CoA kinase
MKIIGISGGIASGKNSVAKIFEELGVAVFDADEIVHNLFLNDQSVINEIAQQFPQSFKGNVIERKILSEIIAKYPQKITIIENIIHPIIRNKYQQFIIKSNQEQQKLVVLNIPLLHENSFYEVDKIIAIIADEDLRLKRYIKRCLSDNYDIDETKIKLLEEKFFMLKNKQISDEQRIKKADFVVYNNSDLTSLQVKIMEIFKKLVNF